MRSASRSSIMSGSRGRGAPPYHDRRGRGGVGAFESIHRVVVVAPQEAEFERKALVERRLRRDFRLRPVAGALREIRVEVESLRRLAGRSERVFAEDSEDGLGGIPRLAGYPLF